MIGQVCLVALLACSNSCVASVSVLDAAGQDSYPFDQPTALALAGMRADVQKELGLTADQTGKLKELLRETLKGGADAKAKWEKKLLTILPAEKQERLQQLAWQFRPDEAVRSKVVAQKIELSNQQQQEIEKRWKACDQKLVNDLRRIRFKTSKDREAYIWKHIGTTSGELIAVLSEEQTRRFKQLLGKRFESTHQLPLDW